MGVTEAYLSHSDEIRRLINKAVDRHEVQARERLSIATTIRFNDNGSITLEQVASPACAGKITLTPGQVVSLIEQVAHRVLKAQAEAAL
ncbi:MAG: hypothetical protein JNL06_03800 [Alphaproteobacteria bacterium]|nr:hypothetical protein [Alphaproteobacteria bacterium]